MLLTLEIVSLVQLDPCCGYAGLTSARNFYEILSSHQTALVQSCADPHGEIFTTYSYSQGGHNVHKVNACSRHYLKHKQG